MPPKRTIAKSTVNSTKPAKQPSIRNSSLLLSNGTLMPLQDAVLFWGKAADFSNFRLVNICYNGRVFPSSEHIFHYEKLMVSGKSEESAWHLVQENQSCAEIKRCTNKTNLKMTPGQLEQWSNVSYDVMAKALREKFAQNDTLKAKLLATGEKFIAEASPFDRVWGTGRANKDAICTGKNKLGQALMCVRQEFIYTRLSLSGRCNASILCSS
jgi:ribA/ribD-fused uncharacterized protein